MWLHRPIRRVVALRLDRDVSNLRSLLATYECEGPEPVARHQIAAHFRFADASRLARLESTVAFDSLPSSDTPERLPVYLVHWQAPEWCAHAAASLLASHEIQVELTVVDNGSRAEQPRLQDLVPDGTRVLVAPANLGYTGGANLALEDWLATRTDDYCLIGSHDLHVAPETMVTLVTTARRHPAFGILAPDLDWTCPASREYSEVSPQPLGWVSGTAMLIGRQCALDVGRFDERFSSYVEDVDFCWRARLAGWRVGFVPGAHAHGLGSASPRAREYIAANRILLELKHHGARGLCAAVLAGSGGSVVTSLGFGRGGGARQSDRPRARPPCRTVARYGSRHDGSGPSRNPRSATPMCGVAGFLQRFATPWHNPGLHRRTLTAMLVHRVSVASGSRVDPEAGNALGHRRLSIVGLTDTGGRPPHSASGRYVISYNGKIDNEVDLEHDLRFSDVRCTTTATPRSCSRRSTSGASIALSNDRTGCSPSRCGTGANDGCNSSQSLGRQALYHGWVYDTFLHRPPATGPTCCPRLPPGARQRGPVLGEPDTTARLHTPNVIGSCRR